MVMVDALKISQVMRNLLYNAINHTKDGAAIVVTVAESDIDYKVSVINPGEPIPEEERALIWERYQRSQHQGGRQQGTGLGLSIVSTILKAHGMQYGVDCTNGNTTFWFALPKNR
jgi:signal transduction histidine kinase